MHINQYKIAGLLGQGGMGRVYKVSLDAGLTDMPTSGQPLDAMPGDHGRLFALKLCAPDEMLTMLLGAEEVRDRFTYEALLMAGLDHPHIAPVVDMGTVAEPPRARRLRDDDDDEEDADFYDGAPTPYYVLEYYCNNLGALIGEAYEAELPTRVLPVHTAVRYGRQVLGALAAMHARGLLQRDVKPFNVMLDSCDNVQLIDFGLSRMRGEVGAAGDDGPPGLKVGTPYYTAPEQEADPASADERADIFSAGVLIWRMLTGRLPAQGAAPSRQNPLLGDSFDRVLVTATNADPDARYQSAEAFAAALHAAAMDWTERMESVCMAQGLEDGPERAAGGQSRRVRSEPHKVRARGAREFFAVDELWRPTHALVPGQGATIRSGQDAHGHHVPLLDEVVDPATGLIWRRHASLAPMPWQEARTYVARLATHHPAPTPWRLPTVDELLTLLHVTGTPDEVGRYCIDPLFAEEELVRAGAGGAQGRWLWSADTKSHTAAWYVDARLGFTWWQDMTCAFHVRAVRDMAEAHQPVAGQAV